MKKNNKIMMTIVLAIVFAIAAGASVFLLLSPKFTTFYVFKQAYRAGTVLSSDMLVPIDAPSSIVVAGAPADGATVFVTPTSLRNVLNGGESLKTNVSAGMPLMSSMLSVTGGSSIEMNMSSNKVAMTVSIDNITGVTEELTSGSSVNVYLMVEAQSFLLMENMRLLEVTRDSDGKLYAATLELTNDEAELLLNAISVGKIYFGLVNSSGYQYRTQSDEKPEEVENAQSAIDEATQQTPFGTAETSTAPAVGTPIESVPETESQTETVAEIETESSPEAQPESPATDTAEIEPIEADTGASTTEIEVVPVS